MSDTEEDIVCLIDLYVNNNQKIIDILFDTKAENVRFSRELIESRVNTLFRYYDYSPFATEFQVRKLINSKLTEDELAYGGSVCYTSKEFTKIRLVKPTNENQESKI